MSDDQHYEIIIRADMAEPVQVLGVLVHELVHSLLPPETKHGKPLREVALRVGLEGKMRHALLLSIVGEVAEWSNAAVSKSETASFRWSPVVSETHIL